MSWDVSAFHFIRPLWLLAMPAAFVLWLLMSRALKTTYWEAHLNKDILEALRVNTSKQSSIGRWLLLVGWIIAALAVAGPTWQKQAVPSFQNNSAMVIVLDLSISMLAEDLTPNRLAQAKYKLIDILRARSDGQTALIAYSGDAHTVTPMTDDPNAIEVLLPALNPNIMPVKGSNTEEAIELAMQLLNDTGNNAGQIVLITDGVTEAAQLSILKSLGSNTPLSILGIGSNEAAPIPLVDGGFLRNSNDGIILSSLDNQQLAEFASQANGRYSQIQINDSDIRYLISDEFEASETNNTNSNGNATAYDNWVDMGHWLVILLLPLAALCFRKGVIYLLPLLLLPASMYPSEANALDWQDLWLNKNQQAQKLLDENPQVAAETFERDDWSGVANYQAKNYPAAAEKFAAGDSATDHYNRGNALALSGDLEEAIQAYEQALTLEPDDADAQHNKELVEQILEQQQEQDQEGQNQEGQDQENQDQQESDQNSDDSQQQESDQSDSQEQESEQSEQQSQEEQSDQNSEEESEQESEDNNEEEQQTAEDDAEQSEDESQQDSSEQQTEAMLSEATPDQLQDSSEQWLRGIQNDPSGLLRRKFEYQTWLRSQQRTPTQTNPSDERY